MIQLERKILNICNNWKHNLGEVDTKISDSYEISKNKLRKLWVSKTGNFLKLSIQAEAIIFSHIVNNLSKNYVVTTDLIDEYLNWCFNHMDFLKEKYNEFSVNSIMKFAEIWDRGLFDMTLDEKVTLKSLQNVKVSSNIFMNCEKFGIALVATKLFQETNADKSIIISQFKNKLDLLSNNQEDLMKLKKMLMKTVENSPYSSEIIFSDYKESLKEFFDYFSGEPWHQA